VTPLTLFGSFDMSDEFRKRVGIWIEAKAGFLVRQKPLRAVPNFTCERRLNLRVQKLKHLLESRHRALKCL
jgi:hypothetical protein